MKILCIEKSCTNILLSISFCIWHQAWENYYFVKSNFKINCLFTTVVLFSLFSFVLYWNVLCIAVCVFCCIGKLRGSPGSVLPTSKSQLSSGNTAPGQLSVSFRGIEDSNVERLFYCSVALYKLQIAGLQTQTQFGSFWQPSWVGLIVWPNMQAVLFNKYYTAVLKFPKMGCIIKSI